VIERIAPIGVLHSSSDYAMFEGVEYLASTRPDSVVLYVFDGGWVPSGFVPSAVPGVSAYRVVPRRDLDRLTRVLTTCSWQGESFLVHAVQGAHVHVTYIGDHADWAASQPGMSRIGRSEIVGVVDISEIADVEEDIEDLPLVG
jgi:hypothetical protein